MAVIGGKRKRFPLHPTTGPPYTSLPAATCQFKNGSRQFASNNIPTSLQGKTHHHHPISPWQERPPHQANAHCLSTSTIGQLPCRLECTSSPPAKTQHSPVERNHATTRLHKRRRRQQRQQHCRSLPLHHTTPPTPSMIIHNAKKHNIIYHINSAENSTHQWQLAAHQWRGVRTNFLKRRRKATHNYIYFSNTPTNLREKNTSAIEFMSFHNGA